MVIADDDMSSSRPPAISALWNPRAALDDLRLPVSIDFDHFAAVVRNSDRRGEGPLVRRVIDPSVQGLGRGRLTSYQRSMLINQPAWIVDNCPETLGSAARTGDI
jgi:hypothetical protein